jgi:transketolase
MGDFESPQSLQEDTQGSVGGGWSYAGRNIHFGVREHAMGAILNGMAVHGGVIPFGATFLIFSDYMRPSIRLAALMKQHVIYVFTHDSIGLGEDGPTHQPIGHLAALRAIPHVVVIRPCDANETAAAWRVALEIQEQPVALVLTRQSVPTLTYTQNSSVEGVRRGAYILIESESDPDMILIASGSEIHLLIDVRQQLKEQMIDARIVSIPSWELFEAQSQEYHDSVLPPSVRPRLAVEAGVPQGWHRYVGDQGDVIGLDRFGASAPASVLMREFGFTVENILQKALGLFSQKQKRRKREK